MSKLSEDRINELCDSYKIVVSLSMLAVAENDIDGVFTLNKSLKRIWNTLKPYNDNKNVQILDTYNKLLALEYSKLETDNPDKQLKIIKLCIDFDYSESLHDIALAKFFYQEKKYPEAIMLSQYLTTICDSAPPYLVLGKCYRDLKMYDMSIRAYKSYLTLNENDKEAEEELNEIFEEMLDLRWQKK